MKKFKATDGKTEYHFKAESFADARHWVINHLDTSKDWFVSLNKDKRNK